MIFNKRILLAALVFVGCENTTENERKSIHGKWQVEHRGEAEFMESGNLVTRKIRENSTIHFQSNDSCKTLTENYFQTDAGKWELYVSQNRFGKFSIMDSIILINYQEIKKIGTFNIEKTDSEVLKFQLSDSRLLIKSGDVYHQIEKNLVRNQMKFEREFITHWTQPAIPDSIWKYIETRELIFGDSILINKYATSESQSTEIYNNKLTNNKFILDDNEYMLDTLNQKLFIFDLRGYYLPVKRI